MIINYFKQRKLRKYLNNLDKHKDLLPADYAEQQQVRINRIRWIIAYYKGNTAVTPKELLESLIKPKTAHDYADYANELKLFNIKPLSEVERLHNRSIDIHFLYNWIYYNEITGF